MDAVATRAYTSRRIPGPAMFDRLYARVKALARSPHAEGALAAIAFAESSFFPIPPDVLLAPMALAEPRRAWRFALVATIASVLGGMLGYAIGAALYDTVGQWLINLYGYGAKMAALKQTYAEWGWLVILIKGATPIPYKLVTITSGLLGYNFPLFVALSALTRGARFFLVAGALRWFGEPLRAAMERNFAAVLGAFAALVVAGFVVAIKVF
jgi:membrane protein YqaA with SNARE-associated domain